MVEMPPQKPITPAEVLEYKENARKQAFEVIINGINATLLLFSNLAQMAAGHPALIYDNSESGWVVFHAEIVEQYRAVGWHVEEVLEQDIPRYHFWLPEEMAK